MSRVLVDTSAVIAGSQGEVPIASLPAEGAISMVTLCELHHGVLVASRDQLAARLLSLDIAQRNFDALPVDHRVAPRFGQVMAEARRVNNARPEIADALIAATARTYDLPIFTRDRDFTAFPGIEVIFI